MIHLPQRALQLPSNFSPTTLQLSRKSALFILRACARKDREWWRRGSTVLWRIGEPLGNLVWIWNSGEATQQKPSLSYIKGLDCICVAKLKGYFKNIFTGGPSVIIEQSIRIDTHLRSLGCLGCWLHWQAAQLGAMARLALPGSFVFGTFTSSIICAV